jgi:hypothetical protein
MLYFNYNNHTIYPTPRFSTASGKWKIQLTIRYKADFRIFTTDITFNTESEAISKSISYGKTLIDEGAVFLNQS